MNKKANSLEEPAAVSNRSCITSLEVRPVFVSESARYETKEKNALPGASLLRRPVYKGTWALTVLTVLICTHTREVGAVMKRENLSKVYPCMLSCSSRGSFALRYPVKDVFPVHPAETELAS